MVEKLSPFFVQGEYSLSFKKKDDRDLFLQ